MDKGPEREIKEIMGMLTGLIEKRVIKDFFTKDIKEYLKKMNELEKLIINNKISQDKAYNLYASYSDYLINKMAKIEEIVNNKVVLKKIKQTFRKQASSFINKVFLMRWGYSKPSGYPGDYKLIEMLYDNKPFSEGLSFCGDKYLLQDSYVEAVRVRKDMMKSKLADFIKKMSSPELKIMNLGCGSCREIRELLHSSQFPFNKEVIFTLVDWDRAALEFSKKTLEEFRPLSIKFNFLQENIVNLYKTPSKYLKILGKQDLIYSIGLADYFPDTMLGNIIKFCFRFLKYKGMLILAHKNVKVHKSIASDWFCDWYFYPRSEEDVKRIIDESCRSYKYETKISEDDTQHIFFVEVILQ